jgi:hypothetical protein
LAARRGPAATPCAPSGLGDALVEPDAGDEVALAVAVDDHVGEQRVVREAQLDVRRGDVLAARGDEDVLLAVDDLQKAVLGERPTSPVLNQPSSVKASRVASGSLW